MAKHDNTPIAHAASTQHDGAVRCGICATASSDAQHEWCPMSSSLICDSCCRRAIMGEMGRHLSAVFGSGDPLASPQCMRCERGRAWLAGEVLDAMVNETLPS